MSWTEKDLENIKKKGFRVNDIKPVESDTFKKPKIKIVKISVEKNTIQFWLNRFKEMNMIDGFVTELRFDTVRMFRFDWAIPSLKIAIEYEGIYSKKSRHTTVKGYSTDIIKYNLAITLGWRVLRYTASNYKNMESDLKSLLRISNREDN